MDEYLKKHLRMRKKAREMEIAMFLLNYGWTIKEDSILPEVS
jgi:hypothetical protein